MEVFVIETGFEHEDSRVLHVHKTLPAAIKKVEDLIKNEGGEWEREDNKDYIQWKQDGEYFLILTFPFSD